MILYTPLQNTNTVFSLTESTDASVAFLSIASHTQTLPWKTCALAAAASTPLWPVLQTLLDWCSIYQFCFLLRGVEVAGEGVGVATSWYVSSPVSALAGDMPCLPQLSCLIDHQNSSIVPDP